VRAATKALAELGIEPTFDASSTDANVALSRGIAAVCIGLTHGGNVHRIDEYIDTRPIAAGLVQLTLLALDLADQAGKGVIAPPA
jgi:di/tripeptidase